MVKQINVATPRVHFKKFGSKNLEVNPDGSIKEYHEKWNDPVPKHPETKESKPFEFPLGLPYKHPPEYLIPVGNGIYTTPTNDPKVSDPQNCNGNLADISPWCGGNPLTIEPIGLDVEAAFDECNVWVEISPRAFLKLPPGQIAYRFPGKCREEPPPPPPLTAEPGQKTYRKPNGLDPNASVFAFVGNDRGGTNQGRQYVEGNKYRTYVDTFNNTFLWTDYICPGTRNLWQNGTTGVWYQSPITGWYTVTSQTSTTDSYEGQTVTDSGNWSEDKRGEWDTNGGYGVYHLIALSSDAQIIWYKYSDGTYRYTNLPRTTPIAAYIEAIGSGIIGNHCGIYKGLWGWIDKYLEGIKAPESVVINEMPSGESTSTGYINIHVDFVINQSCGSAKDRSKLPPPPKTKKDCCMACCNSPSQDNTLLKEILAQIKKANKAIGSDELPASLPKVLNKDDNSNVNVENLAQLWKRGVIYLDGIIGEQPVKIKIQDTDLTTEGDQSQEMVFDNVSEMLAEQFGINMNTSINTELMIQLLSKALVELAVTRKQLHNTQSAVKTLQDYFGFDCREAPEEIPLSITVPQSDNIGEFSMDQFLKESKQKVEVWKLEKSEIGAHKKKFLLLEKAASIIQAVFWRKLPGGTDTKDALKKLLNKQHQTINDVDSHQKDLEAWLEQYENGFTSQEGYVGDVSKPWGDDYENRPKTKIIGKPKADVVDPDPRPPTQ